LPVRPQRQTVSSSRATASVLSIVLGLTVCTAAPAFAEPAAELERRLRAMEQRLVEQERRLWEQSAVIDAQSKRIEAMQAATLADFRGGRSGAAAVDRLLAPETDVSEGRSRQRGLGPDRLLMAETQLGDGTPLPRFVGVAPERREPAPVEAAPDRSGVLTPRGDVLLEPIIEYSHTSSNRLVYRGVEIVPGVQLGVIEANDADRNSAVFTLGGRYGLTNRLELEARLPYVYRSDRLTTLSQRDQSQTLTRDVSDHGLGDIELALRYQITSGANGAPILIGALRAKPPTGQGPYDVTYDEFGVAEGLSTGSGFWGAEAGLTMLYPTDPAVIYAGLGYNYNVPGDVDKTLGQVFIGRVDPGDSISASLGFGLALNPRLSVSLGYSHNYVFPTKTEVGATTQESSSIQVGSMLMGMSFRLDQRRTISGNFEFGVTSDAPDIRFVLRSPLSY
jgi:hypothetical protein